jgi:hypothetical protein
MESAPISSEELRAWLLDRGLAIEHGGMLEPTERAVELGTGLA